MSVLPKGLFAKKLSWLMENVRKPNGKKYTPVEVEVATSELGEKVTHTYIRRLMSGYNDNPTFEKIAVLAKFFNVKPGYFFGDDDEEPERVSVPTFGTLDFQAIAARAEQIDDEEVREVMLQMLGAIKQVREGYEEEKATENH